MIDLAKFTGSVDTLITVAPAGSELYQRTVDYLRSPGILSPEAATTFAAITSLFERTFQDGVIGILVFPGFHRAGPSVVMGRASEVERIVEALGLRARAVTKKNQTPVVIDPSLERPAGAAIARITEAAGEA